MNLGDIWTALSSAAVLIWLGITTDSLYFWIQLRREDRGLAAAYFREVVSDAMVTLLAVIFAAIGILSFLNHPGFDYIDVLILGGLFAGPAALLILGIYRWWQRRLTRRQ